MFYQGALTGPLVQRSTGLCSLQLLPLHDSLTRAQQADDEVNLFCLQRGREITFSKVVCIRINITFYIVNTGNMTRFWVAALLLVSRSHSEYVRCCRLSPP